MRQCESCSTKGLFLKLRNGLCENCYNELKTLESTYDDIIDKMSYENINIREINSSLNKLIVKLRKFDSVSNTVKEGDCLRLLEILMKNSQSYQEVNDNNSPFSFNNSETVNNKKNIIDFELPNAVERPNTYINKGANINNTNVQPNNITSNVVQSNNTSSNIRQSNNMTSTTIQPNNITSTTIQPNNFTSTNMETNHINNSGQPDTILFTNKTPTLELANSELNYNKFIDNKDSFKVKAIEAVQKENSITETIQNKENNITQTLQNKENNITQILQNKENNITQILQNTESTITFENPIDKTTLINEATDIISSIKQKSDNTQDLAYYVYLLKDEYLEVLSNNGIFEIDGINISDLINNTLNVISIRLNIPTEEIPNFFNYVTIGMQTSGQHLPHSEILEICAHKISYGKIIDTFYSYVKPTKTLNAQTKRATRISDSSLRSAPTIEKVLVDLRNFANGAMFIGYNINFISSFINYYYSLYFNRDLIIKSDCLLKLYRIRFKGYYSEPPKKFDLASICTDMLDLKDMSELNSIDSKASSMAMASYKLFEILKYRYK